MEHMLVYGRDNERRMVGKDDTQHFDRFSWGVGDRSQSIRIPVKAASTGCGYYEDRRPAPSCRAARNSPRTLANTTDMGPKHQQQLGHVVAQARQSGAQSSRGIHR